MKGSLRAEQQHDDDDDDVCVKAVLFFLFVH